MTGDQLLFAILLIPPAGGVLVLLARLFGPRLPGYAALGVSALTLLADLALLGQVYRHDIITVDVPWITLFGAGFSLRADALSTLVVLTMIAVTLLAVVYSYSYYEGKPRSASYYTLIMLFLGGMIGTVTSAETILFYLFWEMMLVPSYALLTFWGKGKFPVESGLKYFIYTHIGAVAMLGAILWIYSTTGVTNIYQIKAALAGMPPETLLVLSGLFIFGFAVKMAIFPFHSWLPGTYEDGPLPVTVIISGAMISAGIYGMLRFPFTLFPREIVLQFQFPLMIAAVVTQFYGGLMALTSKRLKRILAYSSISQMGYVLFGIFTGTALGAGGAVFHLLNHALMKALLFMVAGAVFTQTSRQKANELGGLAARMPITTWGCAVGALAIAGAPPFAGFQSEWMILAGGFGTAHRALAVLALLAGVLSASYALFLLKNVFFGPPKTGDDTVHEAPIAMRLPILAASAAILLIGVIPGPFVRWSQAAIRLLGLS